MHNHYINTVVRQIINMTHTSRMLSLDIGITTKINRNTSAALWAKSFRRIQLLARLLLVMTKVHQTFDIGEIVRTVVQVFELWVRQEFCRHDDTSINNAINIALIAMFNKRPGIGRSSVCTEPSRLFFYAANLLNKITEIRVITWTT